MGSSNANIDIETGSQEAGKMSKNESIETFLALKYEFRFNVIKCKAEFREIGGDAKFKGVDKYFINTLKRELDTYGITTSPENIRNILGSTFSPRVNPILDYINSLPAVAPEPATINRLADTITVSNPANWKKYFLKWMVAVIANAVTPEGCQNHTMLVITGGQGKFKTTWLDNICPPALRVNYLFTGKINTESKDTLTLLAEMFLINVDDQLRQLNKRDENDLKNLITAPSVKYRRPYDEFISEYPHIASFMGSVNGNDFLTDPTGSRRFLPFEALNIEINDAKAIDIDRVWAEAVAIYKTGFRYYFDADEIDEINRENAAFQVVSLEEEFVKRYFERPEFRQKATHFLQHADILSFLAKETKVNINSKKLGEALSKMGFEKWQKTDAGVTKWVYSVIHKDLAYLQNETENKENQSKEVVF